MESDPSRANNRAKLYLLDDENEWLDQGTGFPQIDSLSVQYCSFPFEALRFQRKANVFMRFFAEDSGREVYAFEINENIVFERKEGTSCYFSIKPCCQRRSSVGTTRRPIWTWL